MPRFRNRQKADITVVDKKIPNGILEEQGTVSCHLNFCLNHTQLKRDELD